MLSRKLRDETGASFLIALLVFLICAVVASVIVMSASGNVERIQQHREEEQAYLTMSSAAQMLQKDLSVNPAFTGIESKTIYECRGLGYYDEHQDEYPDYIRTITDPEASQLSGYIEQAAEQVFTSELQYKTPTAFTSYERSFSIEVNGMDTVRAVLTMDSDYNIQVVLTSDSDDYLYSMVLMAPASVSVVERSLVSNNACSHTKWERVQVGNSHNWKWVLVTRYFKSTEFTITTEVTWPKCTISKGSAGL